MFGNLFEEDEEGVSAVTSVGMVGRGKDANPPASRGWVNLSGIKNQGGTCYLNSLLQTLLFTPEFREELFRLGTEELGSLADKDKPQAKVRVIPLELQRLFAQLLLVDQDAASTSDLTDSFGWTGSEESSQHDVQELNRILFSALESSLVDTTGSSLIRRLYHGITVNQIVCKECGNISEREEDFLDLTVAVAGMSSLEEALWNMFVEEEMFQGNNLYRCCRCNVLVRAAKSAKLRKLPPFLTISLLRFNFDFAKCERYKETGRYSFPFTIDLRPFCEQADTPDSEYTYELFSVIIHKGGCYGGHYHVYIKDIDQLGCWEMPEEEPKPRVQKKEAQASEPVLVKEDPLSVLMTILSQEQSVSVLVDQLGQKLLDKIGISWNRKFRKQYGPIGKFLQSHSDIFMLVSGGTRVTLKAAMPVTATDTSPQGTTAGGGAEPGWGDGPHWFDINDSKVTPIRERDIEKQFQGKESAYMLFYRKAELRRPEEAKHNPRYGVPLHLVQVAEEENARLQQCRTEFDTSANTIEVRLHLAPHYHLEDGALRPKGPSQDGLITMSFDQRRTVGDLRLAIYQMQDLWEGDMALTTARSLPAGLHLYNTLSDDELSLLSAGVCKGSDLFVWNGREVCGVPVQTGPEWEPVLLTLLRAPDDADGGGGSGSGLQRAARGFPGGATLGVVREALGPEDTLLCKEESRRESGGGSSRWRVFSTADMRRTLRELALRDGDALLVLETQAIDGSIFNLSGEMVTVTTPSDCRWLQVEFRPRRDRGVEGVEVDDEAGWKRGKISASGNMLLSEVKLRAVEELDLQDQFQGVECCLRQVDHLGKLLPPVREDLTVREAGVKLMTSLYLCPGAAPGPTQLFLYFTVGAAAPPSGEMEIILEETLTVKESLALMLNAAGLEGESWHLRRTDWCEEVGDALSDEDATLAQLKINSGDTLVVTAGLLPQKGFLKVPVWLHAEGWKDGAPGNHLNNGTPTADGAMQFIGHMEISVESSLNDLKIQAMTLPLLQELTVPTPAFLRVWVLDDGKLSTILRGNQQSLKKMKLGSGVELCVQRLLKEEDLGPKEVLLQVKIGIPGERDYYPSEELVWDAAQDGSPRSLRLAIATQYGLSADSLLIAKYCPQQVAWNPISSWSQQVSKRKKKKKTENLLGSPFYLKDGDIIGVKNLQIDSNKDFSTPRDDQRLESLRREAKDRANGGHSVSVEPQPETRPEKKGPGKNRKPEVALSINVGVFR